MINNCILTGALPSELHRCRHRLSSCVRDLREWCASRRLQLNASKTELIWFGSRSSLSRLKPEDRTLEIGATVVKPTDVVRDLGVLFDSELTMKRHVSKTVSTCFYHLRRLRQLRRHVDIDTMKQLVSAFIFSRLDYCNAVLYGLPQSTIGPLPRVQNAAAWVTLGLSPRDHVRLALKELHWLPVAHRIQYKVALVMFMVHDNRCPIYLSESVQPVSSNPVCQRLRSASSLDYTVPRT